MAVLSLTHVLPRVADEALELDKYVNFLLALEDRRARSETSHARPFEVTIDPSTFCQLSCPYCEVGNGTIRRARAALDPATHARILEQLGPGVFIGWYFSTGEPLLNKRFPEVIRQTQGTGIFSIVSTNLSLPLSDARIDDLLQCGLGIICVSLDGASAETYRRYRVGGDFSLVVDNLRRLAHRKAELGLQYPLIEWRFLVFRHNQHEIPVARRMALDSGADLFELGIGYAPPTASGDEVQAAIEPQLDEPVSGPALEAAMLRRDSPLRVRLHGRPDPAASAIDPGLLHQKCDWLYFGATLFPSGAVSPCCLSNNEPDDFGVLSPGSTFEDVWNNGTYRRARRLFAHPEPNDLVCSRCPDRNAHDYQFRTTLRALLWNAPEWTLAIVSRDPERFLCPIDLAWWPAETEAIREGGFGNRDSLRQAALRLERKAEESAAARDRILSLAALLSADSPRGDRGWRSLSARLRGALSRRLG